MKEWLNNFYDNLGIYNSIISKNLSMAYNSEPLGTHIKILGGYAFKSGEYKKSGIPVIRISDFQNEKIDLSNAKYYDESDDLKNYELHEGDIIVALTGGTIGKLAIVQSGLGKLYLNQRVGKFKVLNPENFEAEFVYWIARGVESKIKELAWGAAIPNVSGKQIELLNFVFPTKDTQSKIISFLNDLRDNCLKSKEYFNSQTESEIIHIHNSSVGKSRIISESTRQLNLLKKLRQQILQDAIQGKLVPQDPNEEPASALLVRIKAEKEKLVREKKIKKEKPLPPIKPEEIPFEIPENWGWCRMGEIAYIASGSTPKQEAFAKEGIPYLKMYNLRNQKIDFDYRPQYIKEEIHNGQLKRSRTQVGDVLMNIVGPPLGKLAIVPVTLPNANFNQAAVLIRPYFYKDINKWIFWYLNEMSEIKSIVTKGVAGQDNISVTQSNHMKISLPPLSEQFRIVSKIEQLMSICDELEQSIQQNQKYTQELLKVALKEALEPKTN